MFFLTFCKKYPEKNQFIVPLKFDSVPTLPYSTLPYPNLHYPTISYHTLPYTTTLPDPTIFYQESWVHGSQSPEGIMGPWVPGIKFAKLM